MDHNQRHTCGVSYNETRENCWNKNKLLLNSNACEHSTQDLTARAWTNIFREQIELEQPLGKQGQALTLITVFKFIVIRLMFHIYIRKNFNRQIKSSNKSNE